MTTVEKIKALCKERKVAMYKLEKELGFGNGYIGQLKKGSLPAERLVAVANYFSLPLSYFTDIEEEKTTDTNVDGNSSMKDKIKQMSTEDLADLIAACAAEVARRQTD